MNLEAIKKYVCRRDHPDSDSVLERVDAKLGHLSDLQDAHLDETRTIRRDLAVVRRRIETGNPLELMGGDER